MRHREIVERLTLAEKCRLLSGESYWHSAAIPEKGVPGLCLSDGPHGVRRQRGAADRLGLGESLPATCFPTAAALANSWDPSLTERVGEALGREAASQGVGVLLGPGLNLKRTPLCGRNFEYLSEDPHLAGKLAAGYVRGIQRHGVAACLKHFAANNLELRRQASNSVVDERALRELYLTGFEIAVREAAPRCVMSAYNQVNGVYANENRRLLADILRGEWGFDGFVVSDWGGGNDVVAGALAGANLEMPSTGGESPALLQRAVERGQVPEAVIDARVDELLDVALWAAPSVERRRGVPFDVDAHHALAREACAQSAVLLRNEGGLLPLAEGARVALIGDFAEIPRYQGAGSSRVNPTRLDTLLGCVGDYPLQLAGFARGYPRFGPADPALAEEAVALARRADVVLLALGLDEVSEQEGLDRAHMRLPDSQAALLEAVSAANPNVAVILMAGAPVEMPWLERCRALLHGYLCGQAGARGLLDVLCGAVNPSGRLAESYPIRYEDCPCAPWLPPAGRDVEYREGLYVGYRYYASAGVPVRFPFGFGLSYTAFRYSDLSVTSDGVGFTLQNAGERAGAEVAQLYVALPGSAMPRPARELKAFAKVFLEPGEARRVELPLDERAFRYFDVRTGRFEVEGGEYQLLIGASCEDIRLSGNLRVAGSGAPPAAEVPGFPAKEARALSDAAFERLLGRPLDREAPSAEIGMNDPLCALAHARSLKARLLWRLLDGRARRGLRQGRPMTALLSVCNMPVRALGKASGGYLSQEMCRALLTIVNGHGIAFLRGLCGLVAGAIRQGRTRRQSGKRGAL